MAWLCKKHGLDPKTDIYTHKYFYPPKNCPVYILPHWNTFLSTVQKYYNALIGKAPAPTAAAYKTHTVKHGDTLWQIAQTYHSPSLLSRFFFFMFSTMLPNSFMSSIGRSLTSRISSVSRPKR